MSKQVARFRPGDNRSSVAVRNDGKVVLNTATASIQTNAVGVCSNPLPNSISVNSLSVDVRHTAPIVNPGNDGAAVAVADQLWKILIVAGSANRLTARCPQQISVHINPMGIYVSNCCIAIIIPCDDCPSASVRHGLRSILVHPDGADRQPVTALIGIVSPVLDAVGIDSLCIDVVIAVQRVLPNDDSTTTSIRNDLRKSLNLRCRRNENARVGCPLRRKRSRQQKYKRGEVVYCLHDSSY